MYKEIFNEDINCILDYLLEKYSLEESVFILTNSLAILGDKKIKVTNNINEVDITRVNKYKYPKRLSSFIKISSERSDEWKALSFSAFAFN